MFRSVASESLFICNKTFLGKTEIILQLLKQNKLTLWSQVYFLLEWGLLWEGKWQTANMSFLGRGKQDSSYVCLQRSLKFQSLKPASHGTTDPIGGKFALGPGFRIGFQAHCSLVWPPFPGRTWAPDSFLLFHFCLERRKKEGKEEMDLLSFIIVCANVCMCMHTCVNIVQWALTLCV